MSTSATVMMIVGVLIIWGGLAASVVNAIVKGRQAK